MKVLIYARVSSARQNEGKSVDDQINDCLRWAERESWLVAKVVRETGSASTYARKARPQWEEVLDAIRNHEIDAVLTWEASRANRDLEAYATLRDVCVQNNVRWGFSGTLHDLSERGSRFRTGLEALLAEDESARISERVRRATHSRARTGHPHGKQLYGYLRNYSVNDHGQTQLIDIVEHPEQGPIVREAARRVLEGESIYSITQDFNLRGIPPRRPAFKTHRRNLGWTNTAIKQMLTSRAYAGIRQHRPTDSHQTAEYEAQWPALIPPEDFERLQREIERRTLPENRHNRWVTSHLLSGIALCGVAGCGSALGTGKQNSGRPRPFDPEKHLDENGELRDGLLRLKKDPTLVRGFYRTYVCVGRIINGNRTGFHVAMRETHLDAIVTELVLERVETPGFLSALAANTANVNARYAELAAEIEENETWLREVAAEAQVRRDLRMLSEQRDLVLPKIAEAQLELKRLINADPQLVDLASSSSVRDTWAQHAREGDVAWMRHIVRKTINVWVQPIPPDRRGQRGINRDRVIHTFC